MWNFGKKNIHENFMPFFIANLVGLLFSCSSNVASLVNFVYFLFDKQ